MIFTSTDKKAFLTIFERDDGFWLNQKQLSESCDTAVPNMGLHIKSILKDKKLNPNSAVKNYVTTAFKTQ